MAITEAAPGVTVEIVVNGEALPEYKYDEGHDDAKGPSQSTCYIEAQSGAFFEVRARVKQGTKCPGDRLTFDAFVDGRNIDKIGVQSSSWKKQEATGRNTGRELPDGIVQRFCFADLTTSDNAKSDTLPSPTQIKGLGVIKVELHHMKFLKNIQVSNRSTLAPAAFVALPEKMLKGQSMSHSVELKSVQTGPLGPRTRVHAHYIDPSQMPAATYIFHYRSRASLQSMLLIPRTPSPEPAEERKVDAMSRDELIRLVTQHGLLENRVDGDDGKVKRERVDTSPSRRKTRRNNQVTIIELDDNGDIVRETVQPGSATPELSAPIVLE